MAIDLSGQDCKLKVYSVTINLKKDHPLIKLANILPWEELIEIVVKDLKNTTQKGFWWMGRKIKVRMHLGAFILQKLFNLTDRTTEYQIKDNAAFQLFCGKEIILGWHCPDHTKIEEFRNRLTPETQRILANTISQIATKLGFADPSKLDVDSTVQEANISYPSDAHLLTKLGSMTKKVVDYFKNHGRTGLQKIKQLNIDIKEIKKKSRKYFFMALNIAKDIKNAAFKDLFNTVKDQVFPAAQALNSLEENIVKNLPWNIKRTLNQILKETFKYLEDVSYFIENQKIKKGKLLSFHINEVACIIKGKLGKLKEFGRVFQLGRIGGNFFIIQKSTSIHQEDKTSLQDMVKEHAITFGKGVLKSLATDKGYFSKDNEKSLSEIISELGIQIPGNIKKRKDISQDLKNRRAGIEPLIGHVKHGGLLGKTRMKNDISTLASGYASVLGFNLRQLIRYQKGKIRLIT
jgi:transposase, IS5 family